MNIPLLILDFVVIIISLVISTLLRFDFNVPDSFITNKIWFFIIYAILVTTSFFSLGEYEEKWEYSSFKEYTKTILTFISINLFLGIFFYFTQGYFIPRTIFLTSIPISILLIIILRVFYRGLKEFEISEINKSKAVIVCKEKNLPRIFEELSNYSILAIFLQDRSSKGRLFKGIPILYDLSLLKNIPANEIFIDKEIKEDLYLKVVENKPIGSVIRKIEYFSSFLFIENFRIEDVIKREKRIINISIDPDLVYLVTGAAGSIGKFISKELISQGVKNIKLLDCSEENLHNLSLELLPFENCKKEFLLFDIKEKSIDKLVKNVDVIFHCAANKHVPIVENNKYISFKNNIIGLINTIESLKDKNRVFVFISTDKAVNPISFMGITKRIGELITLAYKDEYLKSIVVRFGNVFGTSGSLIPTVIKQINMYNKVFLTSKEVKRFFMIPEEAAKLIISSLTLETGKIAVLDMGEQINIYELLQKIIQLVAPNRKIDIEIIGLRPGEKLEEELFYPFEKIENKKEYIFIVNPNISIKKEQILKEIQKIESSLNNIDNFSNLENFLEKSLKELIEYENIYR